MSQKKQSQSRISIKKIISAMTGIFLVCIGVAFNNNTGLGNDPVGIIYDGLRVAFNIPIIKLGYISNIVNIVLIVILLLIGRHYVNIGTAMYLIPYGLFITIGSNIYPMIFKNMDIITSGLGAICGISLYYLGISMFVAADIGIDPFNGFMMTIRDKSGWSIRRSKITFDVCLVIIGIILGGKFGIITIITAITTGPTIQFLSGVFKEKLFTERNS